jgi:hypothetical protein
LQPFRRILHPGQRELTRRVRPRAAGIAGRHADMKRVAMRQSFALLRASCVPARRASPAPLAVHEPAAQRLQRLSEAAADATVGSGRGASRDLGRRRTPSLRPSRTQRPRDRASPIEGRPAIGACRLGREQGHQLRPQRSRSTNKGARGRSPPTRNDGDAAPLLVGV